MKTEPRYLTDPLSTSHFNDEAKKCFHPCEKNGTGHHENLLYRYSYMGLRRVVLSKHNRYRTAVASAKISVYGSGSETRWHSKFKKKINPNLNVLVDFTRLLLHS
jgi:hypothetical protein